MSNIINMRRLRNRVIALISGQMVNKNRSITEILQTNDKLSKEQVMVGEGLRLRPLNINREVFRKTKAEKAMLKEIKADWKKKHANHKYETIVNFNSRG